MSSKYLPIGCGPILIPQLPPNYMEECTNTFFFVCLFFAWATFIRQYSQPIMRQQHIMQRHSYYATALSAKHVTAAYHAMQHSQSCNGNISCSSTLIMQQEHIMQWHSHYATAAVQHSQLCNGSISCSSILNAIALSHYEFFILLLPAIYA